MIREGVVPVPRKKRAFDNRSRGIGLGDIVWLVTTAIGVRFLVEWWAKKRGKYCGCERRRKVLNQIRFVSPIAFAFEADIAEMFGIPFGKNNVTGPLGRGKIEPEQLFGSEQFKEISDGIR